MTSVRWRMLAVAGAALTLLVGAGRSLVAQGTITGRITGPGGTSPLAESRILVINSSISGSSGDDGRYTLKGVPTGSIQLQVLRVGYQSQKKTVTVTAGQTATADFQLNIAVTQLPDVVTTATGQARRVELGNAIATLGDVGLKVEQSEISTTADLLTAKAPGVVVLPGSILGGAPTVRVRGVSSISLTNSPIWVVDGVRISTGNVSSGTDSQFSLLNAMNPDEIEDIEIVKGPSAATLYGTDAANGVIVVTTKKGKSGASRWTYFGELGNVDDRANYPDMYANWGHTLKNPTVNTRCQLATMASRRHRHRRATPPASWTASRTTICSLIRAGRSCTWAIARRPALRSAAATTPFASSPAEI